MLAAMNLNDFEVRHAATETSIILTASGSKLLTFLDLKKSSSNILNIMLMFIKTNRFNGIITTKAIYPKPIFVVS